MPNNERNDPKDERDMDGESTYHGAAGARERSTPGREGSRIVPDEAERAGHGLGTRELRQGALVSPGRGAAGGMDQADAMRGAGEGRRKNPPLLDDLSQGDGGLSMSGGAAGGARGHAGTSGGGAGGPLGEQRGGPGEYKSTSRGDLDHPTDEATTDREGRDGGR